MNRLPVEKNEEWELTIDSVTLEGAGVGRVDGFTLFVETIKRYEDGTIAQDKNLQADFDMQSLKHRQEMEKLAFQAQLDAGADADKAIVEQQKAQMELEQKAVELDAAKVKADAEIAKAATQAPMVVTAEVM